MATVFLHDKLAKLLGRTTIQTNATTIGSMLDEIASLSNINTKSNMLKVTILVNGRNIHALDGFKTQLGKDDQVWFLVPSGGG
jgi:molybdopterin converting factor small subunit